MSRRQVSTHAPPLQAPGAKRRAVFAKPGGQCGGVSPWDKPHALQSCRLSGPYIPRDRENLLLAETRPEKQQPRPPRGLAQGDGYLLGVDEDDESVFRVWRPEATWIETTSYLRRFLTQRVLDNKAVSFARVWFFKTCFSCPRVQGIVVKSVMGSQLTFRREPPTHSGTLLRDSVFIVTTNTASSPCVPRTCQARDEAFYVGHVTKPGTLHTPLRVRTPRASERLEAT